MQTAKKLKQDEKKVVLAYATLKLKANRLNKELDSMKEHIVNLFERTNQNFKITLDGLDNMLMESNFRVGSKDRLPLAGKIKENVYAIGGLGSRGFSLGPILGEHVASLINHSPSPISSGIALAIEPLRFKG